MFSIFLPTGVDYRTRRFPWVTFTIMGICLLAYLGMMDVGTLDETALYWREGMAEWRSIEDLVYR